MAAELDALRDLWQITPEPSEQTRAHARARLFEAIGGAGAITLFTDGKEIFARTAAGEFVNVLRAPDQPLLVIGDVPLLKELTAKTRTTKRKKKSVRKSRSRETKAGAG